MNALRPFFMHALAAAAFLLVGCAPKAVTGGPAMWRLKDADSEIWIFGTVHVMSPEVQWRTARIEKAFRAADVVWFEAPTDGPDVEREIGLLVQQLGVNPPGVKLSSLLTAEESTRLARVARSVDVDPAALDRTRPWLAGLQLSVAALVKQGAALDSGVENVLELDVARLGKKTAYFETVAQQMHFFADLSPEAEKRFLVTTLRQIEEDADQTKVMDDLWSTGRVDELGKLLDAQIDEAGPEVADAVIHNRNAAWATQIDTMMKGRGKIFIAVGTAHLTGDRGVPALLRAKGYEVEGP